MENVLLFLGAGASVAAPTRLPLFSELAVGVMCAIGWRPVAGKVWTHPPFPVIDTPEMPAEVLFGALRRFGAEFAPQVAAGFNGRAPNAVHLIAAQVLAAGGQVWTTNVDMAVEAACRQVDHAPVRCGGAFERAPDLLRPLSAAVPGCLVKFHGTIEAPQTLAFTDLELLAAPSADESAHLIDQARGRTLILYGYAGQDADLADLLDEVFAACERVVWVEPDGCMQRDIAAAYRNDNCIEFKPRLMPGQRDIKAAAASFLRMLDERGAEVDHGLAPLLAGPLAGPPALSLAPPPGIAHARLVERFGRPQDHDCALHQARCMDARALRWRTLPAHLRWTWTRAVYRDGPVRRFLLRVAREPQLLSRARPLKLRDYLVTRCCGVTLTDGRWDDLDRLTDWAVTHRARPNGRPFATDLYYRAHLRRYQLQPALARADADRAIDGLSAVRDPERLAGALLESGAAGIYQGDFEHALRRAFQLRHRQGRYAIPRWRGWGAWLESLALSHQGQYKTAQDAASEASENFERFASARPQHDARTASFLAHRVALSDGIPFDWAQLKDADHQRLGGRYDDDLDLIAADLLIANGEIEPARARLTRVAGEPSSPIAAAWAELGLAEIMRLREDRDHAAWRFQSLFERAQSRGAQWLATQATLGLAYCEGTVAPAPRPRVLWLLTV